MYYKNLNIFIQRRFGKFFFINELYFFNSGQNLSGDIELLDKFSLVKLNISITIGKKRYS